MQQQGLSPQPQNHSQISSRTAPGVARRGVPSTRHARVCRVSGVTRRRGCPTCQMWRKGWGLHGHLISGPAGGLQGSAPDGVLTAERGLRAQWGGTSEGPELVTHPLCLSPLEGV